MWVVAGACLMALVPYWRDPRIHNVGNTGFGGMIHAAMAPVATHLIDRLAYGGVDVRRLILDEHTAIGQRVVDFGCGTGYSTRNQGVDTSEEMLRVATVLHPDKNFSRGNIETWGAPGHADVVTLFFVAHEMPRNARCRVLWNAVRVASQKVVVADIAPGYRPSATMLTGEPFVLDYLEHMDEDVEDVARIAGWSCAVEDKLGRVRAWVLTPEAEARTGRSDAAGRT